MDRLLTMQVFVQVIDSGSFAAAARALDMSKPMVTRAIAELESHLQTRLLHRNPRNVAPTPVGVAYAEQRRHILSATAEAAALASGDSQNPSGSLRVAMPSAIALAILGPLIANYCKQYPEVSVDIALLDRPIDLVEENVDVAVVVDNMLTTEDVIVREACRSHFVACCSPSYATESVPATYVTASGHRMLCLKNTARRLRTKGFLNVHTSTATGMLKLLALKGLGIAILPDFLIADELKDGRLVRALEDEPQDQISIGLAYPTRKYTSAKVACFVEMGMSHFGTLTASRAIASTKNAK